MGLAAVYAGEAEMDIVMDRIEPEVNVDDAEEAVILGVFATLIEAMYQANISGNARNRLGERLLDANGDANAPACAALLRDIGNQARQCRTELLNTIAGLTPAELLATDGDNHDWTQLGPVH